MPKVTIQGVGDVNFPDSMTPDQIQSAIETDILPKMQAQAAPQAPSAPPNLTPPQPASIWTSQGLVDRLAPVLGPTLEKVVGSNPQGSVVGRVVQGASDPMIAATQIGAHAIGLGDAADQRIQNLEQQYQEQRKEAGSTGFDLARFAGNTGVSFLAPGATASAPASMMARLLRGAGTGAAFNLAQPVTDGGDFWTEKGKQGLTGAAFGAATVPVAAGLARIVSPNTGEAQKTLIDSGMTLTPGQLMGGMFKRAEDAMTSWPVVGDFIRNAQGRTIADMNRAAYARALAPIGQEAAARKMPVGPDGVLAVENKLHDAYDALLPNLTFKADQGFRSNLGALAQSVAGGELPEKEAQQWATIVKKNLGQLGPNGVADGDTFKTIESNLLAEAKRFGGSTDAYQQKLGEKLDEALAVFRDTLARTNPNYAPELRSVNEGWANYTRIRQAAQMAAADNSTHGFTPAQLASAVRAQDTTVGNGATAKGQALMQDLSSAAREVLPSSVPDSGTPFRSALGLLASGIVGEHFMPEWAQHAALPLAAAGGAATIPYTALGQKAAQVILAQRPDWAPKLAQLLRTTAPLVGSAAGAAALPSLSQGS